MFDLKDVQRDAAAVTAASPLGILCGIMVSYGVCGTVDSAVGRTSRLLCS